MTSGHDFVTSGREMVIVNHVFVTSGHETVTSDHVFVCNESLLLFIRDG